MPVVSLPDDMLEQLKTSGSGKIDSKEGPGVAAYLASDRRSRIDIYVGLKLDGFTQYENISSVFPQIKMQFALQPVISCHSGVITFKQNQDDTISIQVYLIYS